MLPNKPRARVQSRCLLSHHRVTALNAFGATAALTVILAACSNSSKQDDEATPQTNDASAVQPGDAGARSTPSAEPRASVVDGEGNTDEPAPADTGDTRDAGDTDVAVDSGSSVPTDPSAATTPGPASTPTPTGAGGTAQSAGGAGNDFGGAKGGGGSGGAAVDPCPSVADFVEPTKLSDTGLYRDVGSGALAEGVYEYRPQYQLWTDGAVKRRFVYLPPCTQIDTSDMNFWDYPRGTKLWKEFVRDDDQGNPVRVETRIIQKYTATKWFMTAFIWNAEQTEAYASADDDEQLYVLAENASGTDHDVPGRGACAECHGNMWDKVLGFSALQLSGPSEPGFMTLRRLMDEQLLTSPPTQELKLPGSPEQERAVGYLHANCGHCHNEYAKQANLGLELWAKVDGVQSWTDTTAYASTVNLETQTPDKPDNEPPIRVVPGDPDSSALYWRMIQPPVFPAVPKGGVHMPLIGTEVTHDEGVAMIRAWISSMQ